MIQRFSNEQELRDKLLEPLFERMGFETTKTHGPNEFGKDFVLAKNDELGIRRLTSLVVKKGNIVIGTAGKDKTSLDTISRQIKQSFEIKYSDAVTKDSKSISRVFFICDGSISDNARKEIVESWGNSKELYEKNAEFIPGEKLVQLTNEHWPLFFSSFEPELNEYCDSLLKKLESEDKTRAINIDQKISSLCYKYLRCNLFEVSQEPNGKIKYLLKDPDKIFRTVNKILIVGESGTGKSYLLREQIKKTITRESGDASESRLKIFCRLTEFAEIDSEIESIETFLREQVLSTCNKMKETYLSPFFKNKKIDLYLDGFDEISTEEKRTHAIKNIAILTTIYPHSQIVVTTRALNIALKEGLPNLFHRFDFRELSYKESVQYLEGIVKEVSRSGEEILKEIEHQGILLSLPKTPLTLQLISSLFSDNASKEIPSNITEVYKMYSEIMLGRWDKQRDVTNTFDYEQKISLLGELAYHMQFQLIEEIDWPNAIKITELFLYEMGDDKNKAYKLLNEIIERSEILSLINSHIKFKHRSFQEFFTAYKIHTEGKDFSEIASKIHDPWWEYVIVFLCGFRKKADDIISYVINLAHPKELEEALFRFRRGKNLGFMVRAGYQSSISKKKDSIKTTLNDFDLCYKSKYIADKLKTIVGKTPKYALHIIFQLIFSHSYYSKLIRKPILEIAKETDSPYQLALLTHILTEFEEHDELKKVLERIRKDGDLELKNACVLVTQQIADKKDVKVLKCKEFRKLQKATSKTLSGRTNQKSKHN
jgi:hypothetical protein